LISGCRKSGGRPVSERKSRSFPLDIAQFAVGEKVAEVIVFGRNRRGLLADIIEVIEANGFHPFKIFGGPTRSDSVDAEYAVFFETAGSQVPLDKLRRNISSLDSITRAFVTGTRGLLVDVNSIPLIQMGRRSVIVGDVLLSEILKSIAKNNHAGRGILRWAGVQAALRDAEWIRSPTFPLDRENKRLLFSTLIDLSQAAGWGKFKTEFDRSGRPLKVRVQDSFESIAVRQAGLEQGCTLLEGYLTGVAEAIFKSPIHLVERDCASRGGKSCVFYMNNSKRKNVH